MASCSSKGIVLTALTKGIDSLSLSAGLPEQFGNILDFMLSMVSPGNNTN